MHQPHSRLDLVQVEIWSRFDGVMIWFRFDGVMISHSHSQSLPPDYGLSYDRCQLCLDPEPSTLSETWYQIRLNPRLVNLKLFETDLVHILPPRSPRSVETDVAVPLQRSLVCRMPHLWLEIFALRRLKG